MFKNLDKLISEKKAIENKIASEKIKVIKDGLKAKGIELGDKIVHLKKEYTWIPSMRRG